MHIKTLVLDNFKSFGRRTELPFYEDFTTISGPNGSGKSNIIDAILFALGLARSHGIRAQKLTDLIYTPGHQDGEPASPGPREASVEVVLDNADGTLSREQIVTAAGTDDIGDESEIRIKRRVKETEENYYSYYYLNGRSVNLSDIRDLLGQAGVTPEGYNVVMQGDVTEIITMSAGQRRAIIDEIAGVAEFDAKKADALDELEVVKDRIDEASLRIEEKQTRLTQLADERETALEYQALREEKQEYEDYLKAAELEGKRTELRETIADIEDRQAELEDRKAELDERAGRVSRLEDELDELNREIERKGEDEQLSLQREIEEIKGEIARLEDAIEAAEDRIDAAEADRREAFVELDRKQETVDDLAADIRDHKLQKASIKADIQAKESDLESIEAEIEEIGAEYEDRKAALDDRKEALDTTKSAKNDLQREQDRLLDQARRRSNEQAELQAAIDRDRERLPEIEAERTDLEHELEAAESTLAEIEALIDDLRDEKSALQEELASIEDELQAAQQTYAELEANAHETGDSSYPRSVTTVLDAAIEGVHGTVGQLGSVTDRYATACETAAGARLANVVVDDDAVGQQCIELLKTKNAGRATFLPLSEMDRRSLPRLPDRQGVIDFAYNLVEFDDQYAGIFSYVLGSTLVVDTLETARALMGEYRMVTLAGDLVERSGAMTGGSSKGTRFSFSGAGGELESVAKQISDLEEDRRTVRASITDVEERLDDARDRKADAADEVRSIRSSLDDLEEQRTELESQIESHEERLDEIESERASVDEEMQSIEAAIAEREEEIDRIEADIAEIKADLAESRIPELTDEAEVVEAEIDELSAQLEEIDGELNELGLERQYAEDAIDDLQDRIEAAQNRKADQEERIEELEAEIDEHDSILEEKRTAIAELEDELADLKDERADLKDDLQSAKTAREEQREAVAAEQNRLEALEAAADRLEAEIDELEAAVEEYDPDEIPDHETVTQNIDRLERAMAELEPVNMLAIEEYDDVEAELTDLEERKATLVEERAGIRERIEAYERQKKETFMAAFNGIDDHFQDVFERLSNGTGELHLETPDDPFDGGLTMKAEPGDKPIQRLESMSGGEKSLTALAFIFAIQRHQPAPFYALDEIDAFLDAANAERVGEMLDELAATAQFIVVSHRAAMLERSDRAIGVTMQDNNVSAVTGIAIADGGANAEPGSAIDG